MQKMETYRQMSGQLNPKVAYETTPGTAVIVFHLFADKKPVFLDRSARVDLTNIADRKGVFLIVPSHEEGAIPNVIRGEYEIAATAVGYLTTHQTLKIANPAVQVVEVVLQRDPSAVVLNEAAGNMPRKARKEANRAVSDLKSGPSTQLRNT